jgi:hypothetical protein
LALNGGPPRPSLQPESEVLRTLPVQSPINTNESPILTRCTVLPQDALYPMVASAREEVMKRREFISVLRRPPRDPTGGLRFT